MQRREELLIIGHRQRQDHARRLHRLVVRVQVGVLRLLVGVLQRHGDQDGVALFVQPLGEPGRFLELGQRGVVHRGPDLFRKGLDLRVGVGQVTDHHEPQRLARDQVQHVFGRMDRRRPEKNRRNRR